MLGSVVNYQFEISHLWTRGHILKQYRNKVISKDTICDAEFILITASKYHGEPASRQCPICTSEDLRIVLWVYGDRIGKASGSARSEKEIELLVNKFQECTVHTVEVCPDCRWNCLLKIQTAVAA